MSISQNFPNTRPSLNLNFARSKTLDPRITFSRPQTGNGVTYVGEDGLIKYVSADEPRFDHDPETGECLGLLVEEQRSNLLTYSEQFDNWTVTNGSITPNIATAPDGTTTADKLVENSSTGNKEVNQGNVTYTSGTSLTISCFAKAAGRTRFRFAGTSERFDSGTNAYFDLSTGTVVTTTGGMTSASITPYPNGWYRCTATMLPTSSGTSNVFITLVNTGTTSNYTGDGSSGIYLWGAQLERKLFATSYMPTSSGQGDRGVDNAYMTDDNFSDWYNQSEGTFYANSTTNVSPNLFSGSIQPAILYATDGTSNNRIGMFYGPVNSIYTRIVSNGVQYGPSESIIGSINTTKSIISYKTGTNGGGASINGSVVKLSTPNLLPAVNKLVIGIQATSNFGVLNGTMSQLTYYPTRLTNAQLQNLTK